MQEDGATLFGGPHPIPTPSIQAAVVRAAHASGRITIAHALSQNATLAVLEAGTDGLAHCFFDEKPSEKLLGMYKQTGAFLVPALVMVAALTGEEKQSSLDILKRDSVEKRVDEEAKECFCGRLAMARGGTVGNSYETVKLLKESGVDILA
jgi:hypothetical protein